MAGRLSSTLFDRGTHAAMLHPFAERRDTYSHQTDPTLTRQFPLGRPRNARYIDPSGAAERRGKHGAIPPAAPAGCRALAPPAGPPSWLGFFAPTVGMAASITSSAGSIH